MIGVLVHHWAPSDRIAAARDLLDRNGAAQAKAPGFVSRETLYSMADETKITTLVVWDSNEAYDAWKASAERQAVMGQADVAWARPTESERFEVASGR